MPRNILILCQQPFFFTIELFLLFERMDEPKKKKSIDDVEIAVLRSHETF